MAEFYMDADVLSDLAPQLRSFGHNVLTTYEVGRRRAGDEEQLGYAAELRRTLVTHNGQDFLLLQRAWRHWADLWFVTPRPIHYGILVVPQTQPAIELARQIDLLIQSGTDVRNRFYTWSPAGGWIRDG